MLIMGAPAALQQLGSRAAVEPATSAN